MAKIFVFDEFNPEDNAMLQALYSRSASSVVDHVEKVRKSGSGKFMETFYLGYGHSSIADCGSTTIFIEKLSILADKAIQDWPLYSGQETSTRYIDMSKQEIIDPLGTDESKLILQSWMDFYISSQEVLKNHIKGLYPKKSDEDDGIYQKAVNARCFDIMRGFLPAGITTQLSWHSNLRQASDKLSLMRHWPLKEVREISDSIWKNLKEKYSHSFSNELFENQENYREYLMKEYGYYISEKIDNDFSFYTDIKHDELVKYCDLFDKRSSKTGFPQFLAELGIVRFDFLLDFGSFRDLQRHRNGVCRMPLLTLKHGFNDWYLSQLPEDLKVQAEDLIKTQINRINKLEISEEERQYYISLGFNVACRVSYGLPGACYVIELRSGTTVHPTLRKIAHKMSNEIMKIFPELKLQSDMSKDDWDIRRGTQDITAKDEE